MPNNEPNFIDKLRYAVTGFVTSIVTSPLNFGSGVSRIGRQKGLILPSPKTDEAGEVRQIDRDLRLVYMIRSDPEKVKQVLKTVSSLPNDMKTALWLQAYNLGGGIAGTMFVSHVAIGYMVSRLILIHPVVRPVVRSWSYRDFVLRRSPEIVKRLKGPRKLLAIPVSFMFYSVMTMGRTQHYVDVKKDLYTRYPVLKNVHREIEDEYLKGNDKI